MTFREFTLDVLGRDIGTPLPAATMSELGFTSKELVILITRIEREIGVEISYEEMAGLSTIESFSDLLSGGDRRNRHG